MKATVLKGLHFWSEFQPDRNIDFNGFFWVRPEGGNVLIDPLPLSPANLEFVRSRGGARWLLLTNADHWRATAFLKRDLGCRVLAPAGERVRFEEDNRVVDHWYEGSADLPEELREDVKVHWLRGGKSDVEAAFYLQPLRAVLFGDAVRTDATGELALLPDAKLLDKPALLESLRAVIPYPFSAILLGDGDSIFHDAKEAYFRFLDTLPGALFNRMNLDDLRYERNDRQKGAVSEGAQLSRNMTCRQLGFHMRRLLPGNRWPAFHYETGEEEIFLVWKGTMKVRTPQGAFPVREGDLVAFPTGPAHAHQFVNDGAEPCTFLCLSNEKPQSLAVYPDGKRIMVGERGEMYRIGDQRKDYWEDEPGFGKP